MSKIAASKTGVSKTAVSKTAASKTAVSKTAVSKTTASKTTASKFLKILNFTNAVEKVEADSSRRTDSKWTIGHDSDTEPYFIDDTLS